MGLDMYLDAHRYLMSFGDHPDVTIAKKITDMHLAEESMRPKKIVFEAAYWRKANAIHQWFVNNCQDGKDDCQTVWASRDKLTELRDLCKQVLENRESASELLPPQQGFFFGSTDYDEWYFRDLEYTVERLTALLELDSELEFYYHASW